MNRLLITGLMFGMISSVAQAGTIRCGGRTSQEREPYWKQSGNLTAQVIDSEHLEDVSLLVRTYINGKRNGDPELIAVDAVSADEHYRPRSPLYKGYNRYFLNGGWTTVYLMLPKDVSQRSYFKAYVQQSGHDGSPVILMECAQTEL